MRPGVAETEQAVTPPQAHARTVEDVIDSLDTDAARGLSSTQAHHRSLTYGPNVLLRPSGPGVLRRWFDQVRNPLVVVLVTASAVTLAIGEYVDSAVIFGVVLLNAIVGYVQESKARHALDALSKLVRTESTVVRDGARHRVPSAELVPGDMIVLDAGDRTPADARLIEVRDLECDESALTGESMPVAKSTVRLPEQAPLADRRNMVYSSAVVTRGIGRAVVIATGTDTEIGAVQDLVASATPPMTPLTRKLTRFSKQLTVAIVLLAGVTFAVGMLRGSSAPDMFIAAVALAVGAIPEGLPAAVTVVLAIGVVRMARRRAIVRHLPAVETLGSTTVICSDKTGTITANEMTVVEVAAGGERYAVSGTGFAPEGDVCHRDAPVDLLGHPTLVECLVTALLCNDAELRRGEPGWHMVGDPTEVALLTVASKAGLDWAALRASTPRIDVLPFESGRRLMATLNVAPDGELIGHVKGAAERVVEWCHDVMTADERLTAIDKAAVLRESQALAAAGLRVIACARFTVSPGETGIDESRLPGRLTLLGMVGMADVARPGVVRAVAACHNAGISVKMITGDHAETARTVAGEVGLSPETTPPVVLTGDELSRVLDNGLDKAVVATDVFARVSPEQKLRLVEALQRQGHIVAMTGDGVNDAPALRRADIGVAMGAGGTEVARDAADMVLADDDFSSIEAAVEEGRAVFDNLRKFITWTLPTNIGEGLVIMTAVLLGATLPILPVQILWINMTTAVFLGLTLAFEPKEPDNMRRPPRPPSRPLLTPDLIRRILLVSAVLVAGSFGGFQLLLEAGHPIAVARTGAINVFVFAEVAFLISCRSFVRLFPHARNLWLVAGITLVVLLQLAITYTTVMQTLFHTAPLNVTGWALVLTVAAVTYLIVELDKAVWRRRDLRAERAAVG